MFGPGIPALGSGPSGYCFMLAMGMLHLSHAQDGANHRPPPLDPEGRSPNQVVHNFGAPPGPPKCPKNGLYLKAIHLCAIILGNLEFQQVRSSHGLASKDAPSRMIKFGRGQSGLSLRHAP